MAVEAAVETAVFDFLVKEMISFFHSFISSSLLYQLFIECTGHFNLIRVLLFIETEPGNKVH